MSKKEVISKMYQAMGGFFLVGVVIAFLAPNQRKLGFLLIGIGIVIGLILQFFFGEDVIRWRKIKQMK